MQLPSKTTGPGELFPEEALLPAIAAGLSEHDAAELWQRGIAAIEAAPKPDPEAFESYIREKIHLLKRREVSSKVENSTGFLLEAIRNRAEDPGR